MLLKQCSIKTCCSTSALSAHALSAHALFHCSTKLTLLLTFSSFSLQGASDIEECAVEFYAGAEAIKELAGLVEPLLVYASPTFAEEIINLPCGGVDDMAVYAARMWQRWASWLDPSRGPPPFPPGGEYCPSPQTICDEQNSNSSIKPMHRREGQRLIKDLYRVLAPALLDSNLVDVSITPEATTIQRAKSLPSFRRTAILSYIRKLLKGEVQQKPQSARIHPSLRSSRLQQGWTAYQEADTDPVAVSKLLLNVLRGSGAGNVLDRLQGETEVERILSFLDLAEQLSMSSNLSSLKAASAAVPVVEAESIYASSSPLEYAGASLSSGDFDGDGTIDVVVTAPGHTSVGSFNSADVAAGNGLKLPQAGAFYIRYGNVTMSDSTSSSSKLSSSKSSSSSTAAAVPESLPQDFPYLTEGTRPFERLGAASCVLDANADGLDDLAVSAPASGFNWQQDPWNLAPSFHYVGEVRIFFGEKGTGLPTAPTVVILGPSNNTHTGLSLHCADVNGDGFNDLLIGSHFAYTTTTQSGRADVFLSGALAPAFQPGASLTLDSSDYSWKGNSLGEWFGYSIVVSDAFTGTTDDETFLLFEKSVGVDQNLSSKAFTTCKNENGGESSVDPSNNVDVDNGAKNDNVNAGGSTLVIIGAPGYKAVINGGLAAVGRISGFVIPHTKTSTGRFASCLRSKMQAPVSPAPLFTITADSFVLSGPTITSKLGHGLALGQPFGGGRGLVLALGMTAVDFCNSTSLISGGNVFNSSAGSVTLLTITSTLKGDLLWSDVTTTLSHSLNATVLASNLPDARFGWRMLFSDVNGDNLDDLIIGAPMKTPFFVGLNVPRNDTGHEAGAVYGYKGGSSFPFAGAPIGQPGARTCTATDNAWFLLEGQGEFGRFGESIMVSEENNAVKLFVSAPRVTEIVPPQVVTQVDERKSGVVDPDSATIEMPGAVYVFDLVGK